VFLVFSGTKLYFTQKNYVQEETMPRVIVFDLDGTLVDDKKFYRDVYSGTLEQLIKDTSGRQGVSTLTHFRENHSGQGELALTELGIPFRAWAEKLCVAPLDLVTPRPDIVAAVRSLNCKKVVYTGSPHQLAIRMLSKRGFKPNDFDRIIGWQPPDQFPAKWSRNTSVFQQILQDFECQPDEAWSVGDSWEADLQPAHAIGMRVAQIGTRNGTPATLFPNIMSFIERISQ
jgi:FMN phosphatase YigB (HAD superfamily)